MFICLRLFFAISMQVRSSFQDFFFHFVFTLFFIIFFSLVFYRQFSIVRNQVYYSFIVIHVVVHAKIVCLKWPKFRFYLFERVDTYFCDLRWNLIHNGI